MAKTIYTKFACDGCGTEIEISGNQLDSIPPSWIRITGRVLSSNMSDEHVYVDQMLDPKCYSKLVELIPGLRK